MDIREVEMLGLKGLIVFSLRWLRSLIDYPIFSAYFAVVGACDVDCSYCYQDDLRSGVMTMDVFKDRLGYLRKRGLTVILFTGGEPLLWKNLDNALAESKSRGLFTVIATNGTLLTKERVDSLCKAGIDFINISVDAVKDNPVSAKTLARNPHLIETLEYVRQKGVYLNCNAVVTRKNTDDVIRVAEKMTRIGIPTSLGFVDSDNDDLGFRLPRDKQLIQLFALSVMDAKRKGVMIVEPDAYFKGYESHLMFGGGWNCSRTKLKSLAVDPRGNFLVCTRLSKVIRPEELKDKKQIERLKIELQDIISRCNNECYANCAFCNQQHPLEAVRDIQRHGIG
jgi:MoaA/NifB/PqqE/SkfB family radical SAM enzyme